jgi:hypothetical protein
MVVPVMRLCIANLLTDEGWLIERATGSSSRKAQSIQRTDRGYWWLIELKLCRWPLVSWEQSTELAEFTLYCSCKRPSVVSRWKWSEVKSCEIARAAYDRGYGTGEEIVLVNDEPREAWTFEISRYLDLKSSEKERNWRQS